MSMGGGGGGLSSTTQTSTQAPYLSGPVQNAGAAASYLYNTPDAWPQYFPGSTVAGFTPAQQTALGQTETIAGQPSPITAPATNFGVNSLSGNYLYGNPANAPLTALASGQLTNPMSNPAFGSMISQVAAQTLPSIVGNFVGGGAGNNPMMGFSAGQGLGSALSPMLSQLYSSGLNTQLQAAQGLGGLYNQGVGLMGQTAQNAGSLEGLPFINPSQLFSAGGMQQQQNQADLTSQVQRYNYGQTLPENMIGWLEGIGDQAPGGTGSLTTPYYTNQIANMLGYATGAGSLANTANTLGLFGSSAPATSAGASSAAAPAFLGAGADAAAGGAAAAAGAGAAGSSAADIMALAAVAAI